MRDYAFQILSAQGLVFCEFVLRITKTEEAPWCYVWTAGRAGRPLGPSHAKIFSGTPVTVWSCIAQVDAETFR
jgi:hypothetical protein